MVESGGLLCDLKGGFKVVGEMLGMVLGDRWLWCEK